MLRTDLLMGRFDRVETLADTPSGHVVLATSPDGARAVLQLLAEAAALSGESAVLAEVAGSGVPVARAVHDAVTGRAVLALDLPPDVRSLREMRDLPPATLRAGLVRLLTVLSRAHLRGRVHGNVDADAVLASPAGGFWLVGWGASRRLCDIEESDAFTPVARDVCGLGAAFAAALVAHPGDGGGRDVHSGPSPTVSELERCGADRDFRRVLSRLLAPDPRDAYSSAGEVLIDLGHPDTLDCWEFVPFVEQGDDLDRVTRVFDAPATPGAGATAVEIVGPHGSGRSRTLTWVAAALRARGAVVLHASAAGRPWGGLASLARQLTQIVGRDSAPWREHGDALRLLVAEDGGATAGSVLAAAAALSALVESALGDGRGAVILDDADQAPAHAAAVWSSLRRRSAAQVGGRVVFVSSRLSASAAEGASAPAIVELGDWSVTDVERFLEGVIANPRLAAAVAPIVRNLAGGLPAEIVGLLRDLESRGSLTRSGDRWRLEIPLHALPEFTPSGSGSEDVRRGMRAAGRDSIRLAEVLAVAREGLSREDCGRLAELSGPRLWAAAEKAERAGLVRRDGATWRLRSERVRIRVIAAMSASRRRSLHREMLVLLRSQAPDEPGPQALHARAARHPDAAALTRQAIDDLARRGCFDSAVAQLVDAEEQLGEPGWGRRMWAERIDLLRHAGRLGEAVEVADRVLTHPETTPTERADALVRRVRALHESRDWDAVIAQPLPEDGGHPEQLAELRYMRAAAMCGLSEGVRAAREARLAAAELTSAAPGPGAAHAALEYDFRVALSTCDYRAACSVLVRLLRLNRAAGRMPEVVRDLARLGGVLRTSGRSAAALAVFRRAAALAEDVPEGLRHVRAAVLGGLGLAPTELDDVARAESQFRLADLYEQTCAPILVSTARLRRVFTRVVTRARGAADHATIRRYASRLATAPRAELLAWSFILAAPLEILGHQPALERFAARLAGMDGGPPRVRLVRRALVRGRLLWSDPPVPPLEGIDAETLGLFEADGAAAAAGAEPPARPPNVPDSLASSPRGLAMAWTIRSGRALDLPGARSWTTAVFCRSLRVTVVTPSTLALALALGIWRGEELAARSWRWIAWVRSSYEGRWFPPLRWQAHLLDGKLRWRAGRLSAAARSVTLAVDQARWLLSEPFGAWGERECAVALRTIAARTPAGVLRDAGHTDLAAAPRRQEAAAGRPPVGPPRAARAGAALPPRPAAALVFAASAAALARYVRCEARVVAAAGQAADPVPGVHRLGPMLVVFLPEMLSARDLRDALGAVRRAREAGERVLVASALREDEIERAGVGVRLLLEAASGLRVRLAVEPEGAAAHVDRFVAALECERSGLRVGPDARNLIGAYAWPGGDGEVAAVAASAAALAAGEITPPVLRRCGVVGPPGGAEAVDAATRRILDALAVSAPRSVGELEAATGLPRRTIQRRLSALTADHVLERLGAGRAVRYRPPPAQG